MWLFLIALGLWIYLCLGIGSLVTRALRARLRSRPAKRWTTVGTCTAVFFAPALTFIAHVHLSAPGFYADRLPPAFETEEALQIEWTTGICALAAFRYSQSAHEALAEGGLAWLNTSADTRAARKARPRYLAWQPTPHPDQAYGLSGSRWFYGLWCLDKQEDMRKVIDRALNEPGSYYTSAGLGGKDGLLLIPARRLIVYLADAS